MTDEIIQTESGGRGRFFVITPAGEAELTYRVQDARMVIDRTFTPPAMRGKNVAMRLLERAVEEARARGLKIVPLCSYAEAAGRRRKDWADLFV